MTDILQDLGLLLACVSLIAGLVALQYLYRRLERVEAELDYLREHVLHHGTSR